MQESKCLGTETVTKKFHNAIRLASLEAFIINRSPIFEKLRIENPVSLEIHFQLTDLLSSEKSSTRMIS